MTGKTPAKAGDATPAVSTPEGGKPLTVADLKAINERYWSQWGQPKAAVPGDALPPPYPKLPGT